MIRSRVDRKDPQYLANRSAMLDALAEIQALTDRVTAGGGKEDADASAATVARHRKRNKLLPRERIQLLLDEGYLVEGPAAVGDARRKPLALTSRGREVMQVSERVQDAIEAEWAGLAGERSIATTRRVLVTAVTGDGHRPSPPPVRHGW